MPFDKEVEKRKTPAIVARQSFDAWGRYRNPTDWNDYTNTGTGDILGTGTNGYLRRGYTMHEHYKEFGLINMNGRVYDPLIGRMLSPDNYIQDPTNSQNYNRYSYVLNNPLKYTDPTGWKSEMKKTSAIQDYGSLMWEAILRNQKPPISGGGDWANNTANGLGAFGFANEGKNVLIDYAAKAENIGDDALKYLKISKGLSRGTGVLGLGVTLADAAQKGQWQNHHTADLAVGIATTFMLSGPWGWAIGGTYFLTDIAVQGYTRRSITENLFDPTPTLNPNKQ